MSGIPVGKRQFHTFLSHAHTDKNQADQLAEWLRRSVGVPVWYDAVNLPPGATIEETLPAAIENSRSLMLLLSQSSVARGWVQQEYRAAINHQTQHPAFRIIPIRLDDVDPPGFLQNYSYITLETAGLNAATAGSILKGLYQPTTSVDLRNGRNTYVSRGWQLDDATLAGAVCGALEKAGLQLIGDAEDQASWVEARVRKIMDTCGAFVAILPYRPLSVQKTSKYVLREWELAASSGLPCLVVPDPRLELQEDIADGPGLIRIAPDDSAHAQVIGEAAAALAEDWAAPARTPYVFYATDFGLEGKNLRGLVKDLVEAVTGIPCILGEYVKGKVVQREILQTVTDATLVLADLSGDGGNVYVEVGAARAADVPLFLLRNGPPGRPVFMLRDQQVWDYSTESELLGRVTQIVYPYRRTLLSRERL